MFSIQDLGVRLVRPTYVTGYSLRFSRYTPLWLYVSIVSSSGVKLCLIVLVVLNATSKLVFRNSFVMVLVFGPWYVNVADLFFVYLLRY
jgi:hypothetical protein